jgi:hypothetical protein
MIEELKALAERATPGPWRELCGKNYTRVLGPDVEVASIAGPEDADIRKWNGERWEADARLICLLRNNLSAILSALEAVPVMKEALSDAALALEEIADAIWPDVGDSKGIDRVQAFARQALAALEPKP